MGEINSQGNDPETSKLPKRFFESYDQLVRDQTEFEKIRQYFERNPVKGCLVGKPKD